MKSLKRTLRKYIKELKQQQNKEQLKQYSEDIMELLCYEPAMAQAETVLLYYSLPDEVCTHSFVERWSKYKNVILPVVVGDELELRRYTGPQDLIKGSFNIWEPSGELFTNYEEIDFVLVPGVAFDFMGNRLGRGKGYYDRILPYINAYKIGVCFPFQYLSETAIPTEDTDIPMDKILTLKSECL